MLLGKGELPVFLLRIKGSVEPCSKNLIRRVMLKDLYIVIKSPDYYFATGSGTNNVAELMAILAVYDVIKDMVAFGIKDDNKVVGVVSDSEYAIRCWGSIRRRRMAFRVPE